MLAGALEHVLHILGIIIPIHFHIFQRDRYTTNQMIIVIIIIKIMTIIIYLDDYCKLLHIGYSRY